MLSQSEIARAAGVSRSAVYLVEKRALQKLKAAIEHEAELVGMTPHEWLFEGIDTSRRDVSQLLRSLARLLEE